MSRGGGRCCRNSLVPPLPPVEMGILVVSESSNSALQDVFWQVQNPIVVEPLIIFYAL